MAVTYTEERKFPLLDSGSGNWGSVFNGVLDDMDKGIEMTFLAGEDLDAYAAVYLSAENTISKADSSDSAKVPALGITTTSGTTGQQVKVRMFGWIDYDDTNWGGALGATAGDSIYISNTAGRLSTTAVGSFPQKVGIAKTDTATNITRIILTLVPQDALLSALLALTPTDGNIIVGDGTTWIAESGATARASLGLTIGTHVQAWDAQLDDIAALTPTDGNIIVGDDTNWVAESGDTARTSLGLGIGDSPQFTNLGLGGAAGADPLTITQNSDTITFSHDGNDPWIKWSDGSLQLQTDEGTDTNTEFSVRGKGTGYGSFRCYDNDDSEYMFLTCINGWGYIDVNGTAPSRLALCSTAETPILCFSSAAEGENKYFAIYGFKTGDAQRSLRMMVHDTIDDSARFYNVSNYVFEGTVRANTAFNLNGTDGLSQTTANPGSVTSSGGIITAMSANPYGAMYANNITETVTVSAANTAYEVDGGFTTGEVSGVTFPDDHYLQVATAGKYLATWNLSADAGTGANEWEGGLMINGTAQDNGTSHTVQSLLASASSIGGSAILDLSANDQVSLFVRQHTSTDDIEVQHGNLNLVRVG